MNWFLSAPEFACIRAAISQRLRSLRKFYRPRPRILHCDYENEDEEDFGCGFAAPGPFVICAPDPECQQPAKKLWTLLLRDILAWFAEGGASISFMDL